MEQISYIEFSEMSVFSKLVRTDSEMILERLLNDSGCGVIVGGERCGRDILSKNTIKILMECSIKNSGGKILSYSHSI